ncbi:MAG: ATP synthase F1 subunit gamma [Phycisphaerales bacterium JB037]
MGKSREIKKRMKAVGNIRRITKTMQMIATSKFARAQLAATAGKPYTEALMSLVRELASVEGADHPLLTGVAGAEKAPEVTLVLSSDRGFCGPYNASVLRLAMRHLRSSDRARVEVVGKKGAAMLKFNGFGVDKHHTQFGEKPQLAEVRHLARTYIERFLAGEVSAVRIVSMRYFSAGKQAPDIQQLLPFKAETHEQGSNALFEFSPSETALLGEILPAAVTTMLFQAFNDAIVSEHVARMVAMKAATDNAGKMGKNLSRQYNRARQAQITTELSEIIGGAAALG